MRDTVIWLEHDIIATLGTILYIASSSFCSLKLMPDGLVLNTQKEAVNKVPNLCQEM